MDTEIRPFQPSDEDAIISLWDRCGLLRPWNDPKKDILRKRSVQPDLFLVATLDGRVVGTAMAGYDGHRGAVYYLAVDPGSQSRGLGRQIMQDVEERLVALGCPKLNILIRTSNLEVRKFYSELGYQSDEAACMSKRLIADN
jgi:ribosomal protein S18 acetylase RimI-like enzyme